MRFLKHFPKNSEGLYMVYELYSFDNFFRLLLKHGLDQENSLYFILYNCSLSGLVFQERIHNKAYLKLRGEDASSPRIASIKAMLIFDILQCRERVKR